MWTRRSIMVVFTVWGTLVLVHYFCFGPGRSIMVVFTVWDRAARVRFPAPRPKTERREPMYQRLGDCCGPKWVRLGFES